MVIRLRTRPSRLALSGMMMLGFLLASWAAIRPWVAQRAASGEPSDHAARRALAVDPRNDRIRATLAALYHYSLLLRDYPAALTEYRLVLRNNPLDAASWLHLGTLYQRLDRLPEADQAFHLAARLDPSNTALLWEIAVAYLDQEHATKTLDTLARFLSAANKPPELERGYELARRLLLPEEVLNTLIPPTVPHYTHYANYLLDHNVGDQALAVWSRLHEMATRAGEPIDAQLQLRIVDLLMTTGQLDTAYRAWTDVTKQIEPDAAPAASNLVSNAGFEREETVGRGFDWKIGGAPGIVAAFDRVDAHAGRRSLRLSFTKSRADFANASQIIPVQSDTAYLLQAYIKTKGLDGSPGISIEVITPAHGTVARTDPASEMRNWTKVAVQFRTPGNSSSITLRIHSEPPPAYLPPLSGSAWIDNVSLTKVE